MGADEYITWAVSVFAEKTTMTGHTVTHWPLSRSARSAAEAKGMGFEWLEKHYPSNEWKNYHVTVIPVFKQDEEKLIAPDCSRGGNLMNRDKPLKFLVDDGFNLRIIFIVRFSDNKDALVLQANLWLPFAPTIGLELRFQNASYPPIKTLMYAVGTNNFTAGLEETQMWDYTEKDVLEYYSLCEKAS